MKVFVFDLLAYGEQIDHLKVGNELPLPQTAQISAIPIVLLERRDDQAMIADRQLDEHLPPHASIHSE